MYKVKVNGKYDFELTGGKDSLQLGGQLLDVDIQELNNGHLHIIYEHKSYNVEVVSTDAACKKTVVKINGKEYYTTVEDRLDLLLKEMGMEAGLSQVVSAIKAPMPGLVLSIQVAEGQQLQKGDNILVLEAMKMENILKSTTEGIVKHIHVSQGDKVEKGQVLITFQ